MSRVELRALAKSFGTVQAVKDVSLDIPDHAFVTLLGPSGCGKTTTLNMIAGLEQVSRGEIRLDDQPITDWAPHERGWAMVFQNYALYPHMNVYGNIAFALRLARRPKDEIDRRVQRVAAGVGANPPAGAKDLAALGRAAAARGAGARPWSRSPRSSCSTSRSRTWTPRCAPGCASRSSACTSS